MAVVHAIICHFGNYTSYQELEERKNTIFCTLNMKLKLADG